MQLMLQILLELWTWYRMLLYFYLQAKEACGDKAARITCWPCSSAARQLCSRSPRRSPSRECRKRASRWTEARALRWPITWVPSSSNSSAHTRPTSASCAKLARRCTDRKRPSFNISEPVARKRRNHRPLAAALLVWCCSNTSAWLAMRNARHWPNYATTWTAISTGANRPN